MKELYPLTFEQRQKAKVVKKEKRRIKWLESIAKAAQILKDDVNRSPKGKSRLNYVLERRASSDRIGSHMKQVRGRGGGGQKESGDSSSESRSSSSGEEDGFGNARASGGAKKPRMRFFRNIEKSSEDAD